MSIGTAIAKTNADADGSLDKYKARLVVLGNHQTYGVSYWDTVSCALNKETNECSHRLLVLPLFTAVYLKHKLQNKKVGFQV